MSTLFQAFCGVKPSPTAISGQPVVLSYIPILSHKQNPLDYTHVISPMFVGVSPASHTAFASAPVRIHKAKGQLSLKTDGKKWFVTLP